MRDTLSRDVRHALRSLRRTPGFTIAVLLILALGIGMSTAMFTVFKTVLVDRLPIAAQDRVVIMHPTDRGGRNLDVPESYLAHIARDSGLFRGVTGVYHLVRPQPFIDGTAVVVLNFASTSANYFDVLGARPSLGRLFRPEDGQTGAPINLVLSYAAWRRKFGGDSSVIGRSLAIPSLRDRAYIIGVAPAGFGYPSGGIHGAQFRRRQTRRKWTSSRVSLHGRRWSAARDAVFALTQRVNPFGGVPGVAQPDRIHISGVSAQSFSDAVLGALRPAINALMIAVALLLLIACVNIGNLSLVRLLGRTREVAVRRAIGASALDVMGLFAVENALLGLGGGVLGFLTATAALQVVRAAAPPQVPRIDALGSVAAPLTAAAAITLVALLVFGVLPSFVASQIHSYVVLRSDSRSGAESRSARRARQWLVAAQIALAVVVLNAAGLVVRTLAHLESMDLGYRAEHLSILGFSATPGAFPDDATGNVLTKQLMRRLEATPGVVSATPMLSEPFIGQSLFIMKVAGSEQPATDRAQNPFVPFEFAGPSYFRAFAIPIRRGRSFAESDTHASERVVIVNETLAKQLWPDGDALGKRLVVVSGYLSSDSAATVVGVASDTRLRELKKAGPVVYFAWEQSGGGFPSFVAVRTTRPLATVLPDVRSASREVSPALVLWKTQTMDQFLDAPLAQPRLNALLLSGFGLVALLLSAIGLYGVVSAGVRRQTHEIGVRMALGAVPHTIRKLVLTQVFGLVGIGVVAGLAGAVTTSRLLQSLLFEVSPIDPLTLAGVCVLLVMVATLAGYVPARRAARIDPVEALRAD